MSELQEPKSKRIDDAACDFTHIYLFFFSAT
jgi:hypothetical protein